MIPLPVMLQQTTKRLPRARRQVTVLRRQPMRPWKVPVTRRQMGMPWISLSKLLWAQRRVQDGALLHALAAAVAGGAPVTARPSSGWGGLGKAGRGHLCSGDDGRMTRTM